MPLAWVARRSEPEGCTEGRKEGAQGEGIWRGEHRREGGRQEPREVERMEARVPGRGDRGCAVTARGV